MLFGDYKANFEARKSLLRFPDGTRQLGDQCEAKSRPEMPPWLVDWAIIYPDGNHVRVKEYYVPQLHPNYDRGIRKHFSYQYGATTQTDAKGKPFTASDQDTVIRLDRDQWAKPHMHYAGKSHIYQESLTGSFIINDVEMFQFIEAVETHRQSSHCPFEDILFFALKKAGKN
jgi:hypothetical protein